MKHWYYRNKKGFTITLLKSIQTGLNMMILHMLALSKADFNALRQNNFYQELWLQCLRPDFSTISF